MYSAFDRILQGNIDDPNALIEDEIDLWHKGDSGFDDLATYLGMTFDEYAMWVETNDVSEIIRIRMGQCSSCEALKKELAEITVERDRWLKRMLMLEERIAYARSDLEGRK